MTTQTEPMHDFTPFFALDTAIALADFGDLDATDRNGPDAVQTARMFDRGGALPASAASTAIAFEQLFSANGYRLENVREGAPVPWLLAERLPGDLEALDTIDRRREIFIAALLPVVLEANARIRIERSRLLSVVRRIEEGRPVHEFDRPWLLRLAQRYGTGDAEKLLRRVDEIPPSLAIAQAAVETGWGTSRFAQRGNALFGQRIASGSEDEGLAPLACASDPGFCVAAFPDLAAAVDSYALHLNTNEAYRSFRGRRARQRAAQAPLDGHALAGTLERYSAKGWNYVTIVRAVIRDNRLEDLDRARLAPYETRVAQLTGT